MFNLPPNLFQNLPWLQNLQGGGAGNSKWSQTNPFRTVQNNNRGDGTPRQYGSGLNASAGQLYDHFHRKVGLDKLQGNMDTSVQSYGLSQAGLGQSMDDFLSRRNPQPVETPVPPPKDPGNIPGTLPGLPPGFQMPDLSKLGIFNIPNFAQQQPAPQQPPPQAPTAQPMPSHAGWLDPNRQPTPEFTPSGRWPQPSQGGGGGLGMGMTNPQVPQFDPSIFNMQPQMGGGMGFGVARPQPGGTPRTRGMM